MALRKVVTSFVNQLKHAPEHPHIKYLTPLLSTSFVRGKSTAAPSVILENPPKLLSALPAPHYTAKVIFDNNQTADFKFIWLRDNCKCSKCQDPNTRQKLLDTPSTDVHIKPKSLKINEKNQLEIKWPEDKHVTVYDSDWLYRYGQCFMHETFESGGDDLEVHASRPPITLWDRISIWKTFPEVAYEEFISGEEGIKRWLDLFYRFGFAVLRGVPTEKDKIVEVVKQFAYVKETQYGVTFDVINEPDPEAHLAYSGAFLFHHTDMNYREKSPGMQLLHCLKAEDPRVTGSDPGGKSFFVDGFRIAKWLEEYEPSAYHILTTTPIRFQIKNQQQRYSQLWPIICVDQEGDLTEVHYNNRTMGPLQVPSHVVVPFYHAYRLISEKMRDPNSELMFHMLPGDLVAFNNRRILHGRTGFDPMKVSRHLQGCYVDIDEALARYDSLLTR